MIRPSEISPEAAAYIRQRLNALAEAMSGSGATCFALFADPDAAEAAAQRLLLLFQTLKPRQTTDVKAGATAPKPEPVRR